MASALALRFNEIRHAARRLRRVPTFTAATMFVLALGIGATTAVHRERRCFVRCRIRSPERLVDLSHTIQGRHRSRSPTIRRELPASTHNTVFDGVGATRGFDPNVGEIVGNPARTERVFATGVSASLFGVLRAKPLYGRGFLEGEDRKDHSRLVVWSEGLWRRKFGGDESVVGKQIVIDGAARTVVGIMPSTFQYPGPSTELWIPLAFDPAHANPGSFNFGAVARLKPGVSPEAAQAELNRLLPRLLEEFPSNIPPAMWARHTFVRSSRHFAT
jgi:hypothetical protein